MKLVAVALLATACVDQGPGPGKHVDPSMIAEHLLKAAPADITHVDVTLGDGKLVYLGNIVDKTTVAPGGTVKIKHYWRVVAPITGKWRPFVTVRGAPNTADFVNVPASEMQIGHPVEDWKAGEIIEDEQDITLRPDWKSKTATVLVGLIAVGKHDTLDRMAASGPNTLDRAVIARKLDVDLSKAPPPIGTIYLPHAAAGPAIVIDGVANDPGWSTAAISPEFATAEGSPEPIGKATAKLTWDEKFLYVFVSVTDSDVFSEYKTQDDPIWKQDAIEMFVDAEKTKPGYVELQVNPNNTTFDSWFGAGRTAKGDEAWDSAMITAVKVRGTADVANDTDQGWDVEIAIPLAAVKGKDDAMPVNIPPVIGDRWRMNVVRVDKKSGAQSPAASSWNRISYSDWHGLDRLLTIVFADQTGSITPVGTGGGSAAGSGASKGSGSAAGSGASMGSAGSGSAAVGGGSGVGSGSNGRGSAGAGSAVGGGSGSNAGRGSAVAPPAGSGSNRGSAAGSASGTVGVGSGAMTFNPGVGPTNAGSGSAAANRAGSNAPHVVDPPRVVR